MRITPVGKRALLGIFFTLPERQGFLSNRFKKIFFPVVLFLVLGLTAEGSENIITMNYPPDRTVMELGLLSISLSMPKGSADLIKVNINDEEKANIVPVREVICFTVRLSVGINKIDIAAIKNNKAADRVLLSVFRRSDLVSAHKDPPAGFQKDYFHMKEWSRCSACHKLEPGESDKKPINIAAFSAETSKDIRKAAVENSTCYSCHKGITSYPYVHGPASVWSCLSCHNPQAEPKYLVKKPDTELCFICHTEQKEDWGIKKYIHGPVNTGNCAICHSPHASENPFNLVQQSWDLCISCHVGKETGRHIIAGYVYSDSHPTRGKPDPLRPGKELVCTSCHDPHVSDYPKLWALNAQSAFVLCQKCHQK